MKIHQKLYEVLDKRNNSERINSMNEARNLLFEAKKESNINKYKEAKEILKRLGDAPNFGGRLRKDPVTLNKTDIEVPDASQAVAYINSYNTPEKIEEFKNAVESMDIFSFIDYCVKISADLIKYQPFQDGNKRTIRGLLNLMFKYKNIPPVYIKKDERDAYKDALISAMKDGNYKDLQQFYYFKVCDSIYVLDFRNYDTSRSAETTSTDLLTTREDNLLVTKTRGEV